MKNFKSHFKFSKQERSGIFFLLLFLVLVQTIYFFIQIYGIGISDPLRPDNETQARINDLKRAALKKDTITIYPFNPNFISDYKGYTLGMSVTEIDRLHLFRETNKFVNTKEEFKQVTLVSDSLLSQISPYFKFPDWTRNKFRKTIKYNTVKSTKNKIKTVHLVGLNTATAEQLKAINGIGEKLSARIIKFRDRLGGFLINDQLYDVYGLDPVVVRRVLEHYKVKNPPKITKIDINSASVEELSKLVYLQRKVAQRIVEYRNLNGGIQSFDELSIIDDFPADRINRIALYLFIKK